MSNSGCFITSLASIMLCQVLTASTSFAKAYCDLSMEEGTVCMIALYDLHPTQSSVGMRQIEDSVENIQKMDSEDLRDHIHDKKIPIVVGPDGNFFMTDRHHMVFALYTAKGHHLPLLVAKVKKNWSHQSQKKFWRNMYEKKYVYLFDEHGLPLASHTHLPTHITELKNDPYRSLAWAVRERGGFNKTDIPFAEFQWANFFRNKIAIGSMDTEFETALTLAMGLSSHRDARNLPGFKQ